MRLIRWNEYLQPGGTGKRLILESETDYRSINTSSKNSSLAPFISQWIIKRAESCKKSHMAGSCSRKRGTQKQITSTVHHRRSTEKWVSWAADPSSLLRASNHPIIHRISRVSAFQIRKPVGWGNGLLKLYAESIFIDRGRAPPY